MGTAVVAGGKAAPVLELGQQVLHPMAHLVAPLAVRDSRVPVPPGRDAGGDALLPRPGADLVPVIALSAIKGMAGGRSCNRTAAPVQSLPCPALG